MPRLTIYLLLALTTLFLSPEAGWSLQPGEHLPPLTGQMLNGDEMTIEQFRGQPILLKIGTTWCPTCGQQSREISKLHDYLDKNKIKYIEVFVQETPTSVNRYFDENKFRKPDLILLDNGSMARALNLYLIPRVVLIDRQYKVFRDGDPLMADALKQLLQKMLTEK